MARIYNIYAAVAASTNNAANVEVASAGRIKGVTLTGWADLNAAGEAMTVEISTVPYAQVATNDAQGPLATFTLTAGAAAPSLKSMQPVFFPLDVPVPNGQRIYANFVLTGTNIGVVNAAVQIA